MARECQLQAFVGLLAGVTGSILPRLRMPALVLALLLIAAVLAPGGQAQAPPDSVGPDIGHDAGIALVVTVEGAIGPATTLYLRQAFEAAAAREAALIVLKMDTPGGLVDAMRDIIRDILASPIPVVTYVAPPGARAASAGTYILYASHLAAMAPGTNLGAATPVQIGGGFNPLPDDGSEDGQDGEKDEPPADAMAAKAINDAVAYIRGLADLHGRNADWAERAVRQAASLPAREALAENVIELIATDLDDLLAQADGRTIRLGERDATLSTRGLVPEAMEPDWRVQILRLITDPNIAFILMLVGIYGIIFEFMNPGAIFPGVTGGIALLVGLFSLNLLPINAAGIGLVLLGIALMTAEAFAPSFGILGIGGMAAFALGALFMFDEVPGFALSPAVVATATAASVVLLSVALTVVVRAHRREVVSGDAVLIGAEGTVLAWSGHAGEIRVLGERWRARADTELAAGDRVRVAARDSLVLTVAPAPKS